MEDIGEEIEKNTLTQHFFGFTQERLYRVIE
jgi:hypothetical protein